MRQVWCKVKSGQWGSVGRVGKGRGQGKGTGMQPPKRQNRKVEEKVIPSAVQCRGEKKMARRGRVWRNAMQGQSMDEQPDEAGVRVVVRLLCSLRFVARWGKEGGDGPTVLVVLCTGQPVDFWG